MSRPSKSEPWRSEPNRHYCPLCNAWMSSDRTSIALHENGRKHKEAVERNLQSRRQTKLDEERRERERQESLRAIERAAGQRLEEDLRGGAFFGVGSTTGTSSSHLGTEHRTTSYPPDAAAIVHTRRVATPTSNNAAAPAPWSTSSSAVAKKEEMSSWNERKNKRKAAASAARNSSADDNGGDGDRAGAAKKKRKLANDEGHYTLADSSGNEKKVYLECKIYARILEEDMPVEIWTGNKDDEGTDTVAAIEQEMKRADRQHLWKTGLVLRSRQMKKRESGDGGRFVEETRENADGEERYVVDVAYLRKAADEDETIERSVELYRLRILLGSDEMVPNSIEEARLELMGGEEIVEVNESSAEAGEVASIDENTGLASWGTVSVRKVSANRELKEERARIRAKKREEATRVRQQERETQERKMEEAKVANADDSALGSYDVWTGGKAGYRGVDIMKEDKIDVADTAKSLSKGKGSVSFKKSGRGKDGVSLFKKAKKKQNRRVTSADDDD